MQTLTLVELYTKLAQQIPEQHWPAETPFEIALGAILVQNTAWQNVPPAIANLKQVTNLKPQKLLDLDRATLMTLIRPSGFFKNKSLAIVNLLTWYQKYDFDLTKAKLRTSTQLRQELLDLHGIGAETADVILLYVLDKPQFIADSYARRLFLALGVTEAQKYDTLKSFVEAKHLTLTLRQWQAFHGYIDEFGKQFLRRNQSFAASYLAGYRLKR
ncbi:endonuclease III domain-containing protein [Agrilactobacillus fermenti]|uniref:endonuclease III domain-containing protein n=1 Tax=Agrilactobacillus fermenti TaxID=2586909 RepID=UPI001E52C780|nr:deoxyribonuclease I [Agrilactobacillus fermenti]MCD2255597.1 deoxyribonuclease I [Agrilactobacillus fermenti]